MIFAPLNIQTCYTFLRSGLTLERISRAIKKNNYFGAGISDINVMYGVPFFVKTLEELHKPYLVGTKINIDGDNISLYALNEEGYRNLCLISSNACKGDLDTNFIANHHEGLVAIIATNDGNFKELFSNLEKVDTSFTSRINKIAKLFEEFYLGIEVTSREEVKYANKVREFASNYAYTTIAFPRILYEKKEDAIVLTMVKAIDEDNKTNIKKEEGQYYFMKEEDYKKIYSSNELVLTIELINKSTFNYHIKRGELLHYPVNDSPTYLRDLVAKGIAKRCFGKDVEYLKRANHELDVIIKMGYADYFLIVQDYVNYAKNNGILVGSGRGSAAGSLVSYALGITDVDPLKYDLQFERFLNEGRKSMPDIDIDFMDTRRDEMVEYMRQKYGTDRVANIVTFQTIGAKQALRDVGRIYEYHNWLIDNLSKAITNPKLSLRECYKTLPAFKSLIDSDQYYLEIVSLASKIEGLPRQSGLHAAGVVINQNPIQEVMPVAYDINDNLISQYEMHFLEEQGFLKMDFLSIRNLTIIDRCLKLIEHYENIKLNIYTLNYDVKETYDLIRSGKVMGLFQLESPGMKKAAKKLEPTCFDDIVALISLFRPGPMASIPTYGKRKKGLEKPLYLSEELKKILAPTYGILVYQEQVNSIAMVMAGFNLSEADLFRRGIAKKEATTIKSLQDKFIQGSIANGYKKEDAIKMFNDISKFANYGFNKSHAVGYAIVGCQMAYLKAKYPLEFYASILTTNASTNDMKFGEIVNEMKSLGLKVSLPNINISESIFIINNNQLIYPLNEIRGIPNMLASSIIEERNMNGKFTDFFNFVSRIYPYHINEKQLSALISSGAFDSINPSRASLKASIERALQYAELTYNGDGQMNLSSSFIKAPSLVEIKDDPLENLNLECDALGVMLSDNLLTYKEDILKEKGAIPIVEIAEHKSNVTIGGIIKTKKVINTKKGVPMAFIKLIDNTGEIEIVVFSDLYGKADKFLELNNIVIVNGRNQYSKGEYSFIADDIVLLGE